MREDNQNSNKQGLALDSRKLWRWIGFVAVLTVVALLVVAQILIKRAEPILKGRVIETLSARFGNRVELDDLQVAHGLAVEGRGLRIFPPDDVINAGATQPLIAVQKFAFHASVIGLFWRGRDSDRVVLGLG